jgi:hypothetical protein
VAPARPGDPVNTAGSAPPAPSSRLPALVRKCLLECLRLAIRYDAFAEYTFSYEFTPGGRTGPDLCELVIAGPTPWRSPNATQSAELIATDLMRIRQLATQPT